MPVLIVGAACDVGRHLARLLLAEDAQVRVYLDEVNADLRAAGCHVAVGEYDDLGRMESAMEQVHTVVHLAGGAEPPRAKTIEWFNVETTDVAVRAAVSADVVRFLTVTELGADASSRNAYLRSRGLADDLVAEAPLQTGTLVCAPILGPATPLGVWLREARAARTAIVPGDGTQRTNPVAASDVAAALLRADSRDGQVRGRWEFGGPDTVTFAELAGNERIAKRRNVPGLPRVLAEAYATDHIADPSSFLRLFPMALTPLASMMTGWSTK